MITLESVIASAARQAQAVRTTVYVHRHRGRGYIVNRVGIRKGKPAAALVTRDGIVAFWSETVGRHVTVPA